MACRLDCNHICNSPPLCCTSPTTRFDFSNSPQGKLTVQIASVYFSSTISNFQFFTKICIFSLNSLPSYLSELICHEEGRCICFWLHVSNMRSGWMVDVVVWKNLKIKYFKKLLKVLKNKVNEEFSHSFSSNYRILQSSWAVQVTNILSDTLQFLWYSLLTISRDRKVYMYVHSYFNSFVTAFSPSL